jgi:predicted NBD/HSP70 family sugar kinase
VVLNGEVLRGASDSAGEWGHTTLVLDGEPCRCGAHGCVEAYVGAPAILRRWAAAGGPRDPGDELAGIAALAQAIRDGDPTAARVIAETGRYLGAGLANLVNMLNPDTVVLGGFVIEYLEEWLMPAVRAESAARALPRAFEPVRLVRSPISGYRTCIGMATFALERFLSDLGVPSRRLYAPVTGAAPTG